MGLPPLAMSTLMNLAVNQLKQRRAQMGVCVCVCVCVRLFVEGTPFQVEPRERSTMEEVAACIEVNVCVGTSWDASLFLSA